MQMFRRRQKRLLITYHKLTYRLLLKKKYNFVNRIILTNQLNIFGDIITEIRDRMKFVF